MRRVFYFSLGLLLFGVYFQNAHAFYGLDEYATNAKKESRTDADKAATKQWIIDSGFASEKQLDLFNQAARQEYREDLVQRLRAFMETDGFQKTSDAWKAAAQVTLASLNLAIETFNPDFQVKLRKEGPAALKSAPFSSQAYRNASVEHIGEVLRDHALLIYEAHESIADLNRRVDELFRNPHSFYDCRDVRNQVVAAAAMNQKLSDEYLIQEADEYEYFSMNRALETSKTLFNVPGEYKPDGSPPMVMSQGDYIPGGSPHKGFAIFGKDKKKLEGLREEMGAILDGDFTRMPDFREGDYQQQWLSRNFAFVEKARDPKLSHLPPHHANNQVMKKYDNLAKRGPVMDAIASYLWKLEKDAAAKLGERANQAPLLFFLSFRATPEFVPKKRNPTCTSASTGGSSASASTSTGSAAAMPSKPSEPRPGGANAGDRHTLIHVRQNWVKVLPDEQ